MPKSRNTTEYLHAEELDPTFESAYAELKQKVDGEKFGRDDILIFAVLGMQIVERYTDLSGQEKKELVIDLSKRVVNDLKKLDEAEKASLLLAIDMLLPAAIDQIVAASRGQLDLNKIGKRFKKCFACKPKKK